ELGDEAALLELSHESRVHQIVDPQTLRPLALLAEFPEIRLDHLDRGKRRPFEVWRHGAVRLFNGLRVVGARVALDRLQRERLVPVDHRNGFRPGPDEARRGHGVARYTRSDDPETVEETYRHR